MHDAMNWLLLWFIEAILSQATPKPNSTYPKIHGVLMDSHPTCLRIHTKSGLTYITHGIFIQLDSEIIEWHLLALLGPGPVAATLPWHVTRNPWSFGRSSGAEVVFL
jgi:hypothetical protein